MTGLAAFLRKELTETLRTWRVWVIPGMLVFFGATSPIIAAITPGLVRSMSASQPGVVIQLPPPTALDAGAQFLKNLDQFLLIAIVITAAGAISGERSSGTAILVLTKPLSRRAFVVAKMISQIALLVVATVLGTAACIGVTAAVFDDLPTARLVTMVALWLVYASLLVVVMTFFSAALRSRGAAAGAGLAFFFVTLLASNWAPASQYTFLGLLPAMSDALSGAALSVAWPLATTAVALAIVTAAAVRVFERQEL